MFLAIVILASFTELTQGQDLRAREVSKGVDWLTRYGYLPPPDPRTGQLQTLQGLTEAIRSMQRFGGIRVTGELDDETLGLMKKRRCSLPDIIGTSEIMRRRRKRYALAGTVWKKKLLTWRVNSYSQRSQIHAGTVRQLLMSAFQVWSRASLLQFKEVSGEADIVIDFSRSNHGDGYPFDGPEGTLAHAFFPGDHHISGNTHFDDDETWTYNDKSNQGTDLFSVAVHEFGHAIGLAHSSAKDSIMKPYYDGPVGEARTYELPQDDIHGIEQLYGKKSQSNPDFPGKEPTFRPNIPDVPFPSSGPRPTVIDRCSTTFDAVANIRGEAFFFKDHYFWRMQRAGNLVSLNAAHIRNFWHGLPSDLKKIDSVYERLTDNRIVFFIGRLYWVFSNTAVDKGYPRPITDFGLNVDRIDAVFVWPHNGKTYFFKGGQFWRYDEQRKNMDPGYPKELSLWRGIGHGLDGVMAWSDGFTYFFKGRDHWRMEGGAVEVESSAASSTHRVWMHCDVPAHTPVPPDGRVPNVGECSCGLGRNSGRSLASGMEAIVISLSLGVLLAG
ncbi:matrix metalloproteinase-17-like [Scyliorhinus torazame]|uniref:matrix metalloproteinase-17-like n=1 Tax=Scyliorhinus torazame TaxID=75743 RepID=UPI003B5C23DE